MIVVKSYTDLPQSKRLSEILSHESADMCWTHYFDTRCFTIKMYPYSRLVIPKYANSKMTNPIPAWSLSALLGVLPSAKLDSSDNHRYRLRCNERFTEWYDNAIDACVEMIEKLHEQKLLNYGKIIH